MFQFIIAAALSVAQPSIPSPQDQGCYNYYLKMRDIEFGSLEYVVKRDKKLELRCGAYRREGYSE